MTPAQTLRHFGEGGGCSQRSRETAGSGEASEWKRKTHGRSTREKSFTGRPAANSSMDQGLGVEQRLVILRNEQAHRSQGRDITETPRSPSGSEQGAG